MILANPPSYLTAAQFKAQPNDYDLTTYTDAQLQDILNRASGNVDSILRKSLLAREETVRYYGDGSNRLEVYKTPLLYVKRIQIVFPGSPGLLIPINTVLIDYQGGGVQQFTPILLQGYLARFPINAPIDVTMGHGYGSYVVPPIFSSADSAGPGLTPGLYNVALTTKTMWGETSAAVSQITTATGAVTFTVTPTLGAYLHRAYLSSAANNTTLNGATAAGATSFTLASGGTITVGDSLLFDSGANAEILKVATKNGAVVTTTTGALYAHSSGVSVIEAPVLCGESPFTAYNSTSLQITVNALTPPSGIWPDTFQTVDSSAPPLPAAVTEATRLIALSIIWEQNNLANRGVYMQDSGGKRISWRSTEGNSGRGIPIAWEQAQAILKPYSLQAIF